MKKERGKGMLPGGRALCCAVAAVFLCLCLAGCSGLMPELEDDFIPALAKSSAIQTEKAVLGTLKVELSGECFYVPENTSQVIYSGPALPISAIYVSPMAQVKAGDILYELDAEELQLNLRLQYYDLELARLEYEKALSDGNTLLAERNKILLEIEQEEYDSIQQQLQQRQIRATADGVVTYLKYFNIGDNVRSGEMVATIADLSRMVLCYEGYDDNFSVGQRCDLTSPDGSAFSGTVSAVDKDSRKVYIIPDSVPKDFSVGDRMSFYILVDEVQDAVIISKSAVSRNADGTATVNVLVDGVPETRAVVVGLESAMKCQIVEGISEGEEVVLQ